MLSKAACIQAKTHSSGSWLDIFVPSGLKNPICIIPNGVDLPQAVECSKFRVDSPLHVPKSDGQKVLLYLGRIHPKKGLVNLLKAWAAVQTPDARRQMPEWILAIAGWDQGGHEKELQMLSAECGIQNSVVFLGPQFGEDKAACYRDCDAYSSCRR